MSEWSEAQGVGPITTGPIRWPGKDGPYELTLHFEWIEGRWECVRLDVRAIDPNEPGAATRGPWTTKKGEPRRRVVAPPIVAPAIVTSSLLRSIPLARLIDKHLVTFTTAITTQDMDGTVYTIEHDYTARLRRGGRPAKYGPEHFGKVARIYREGYANRTPTRAVAAHFKVSFTAAAKWIAKCRELGLLPPTTRGRARAVEPTTKKPTKRQPKGKGGKR